ncbi:hypothetical protein GOP47_0024277 [Adiantum capillus-veneris]|uniref:Uncharacterized protein n=1 Tax=Adiantum capillus-veneris TaxID=13818 RepID=A0A9D4U5I9_ADICA|nr:hypothetical protein GOP47_0024277 [Adiantum capillus-veneris]
MGMDAYHVHDDHCSIQVEEKKCYGELLSCSMCRFTDVLPTQVSYILQMHGFGQRFIFYPGGVPIIVGRAYGFQLDPGGILQLIKSLSLSIHLLLMYILSIIFLICNHLLSK